MFFFYKNVLTKESKTEYETIERLESWFLHG